MKRSLWTLLTVLLIVTVLLPLPVSPASPAQDATAAAEELPTLESLMAYMNNKTVENCEKAIKGYEKILAAEPNNVEALIQIANAYIAIIDIKTDALMVEKDEFKPILRKYGKLANDYALRVYALKPIRKEVVAVNLVSYGYLSASYGIIKAVFKGAAGKYKDLCKELNQIDEKYYGALGYRSLAKLYDVAPWPVGSTSKALKNYKKALSIDNGVLFTHFFVGVIYFEDDEFDLAEKELAILRQLGSEEADELAAFIAKLKP